MKLTFLIALLSSSAPLLTVSNSMSWICRIKSTFLSHLYFSLFTICPLTLFPMAAQCFLSPLSASLGDSLNFKLGRILILLFRMPSSSLPSLPADHILGRAERSQAFLVRTHLDSNPDLATCFVCWPRYLISLTQIFVCKMRTLLFHYYKDWKRVAMKYSAYLTETHFLLEPFSHIFPFTELTDQSTVTEPTHRTSIWFAHSFS